MIAKAYYMGHVIKSTGTVSLIAMHRTTQKAGVYVQKWNIARTGCVIKTDLDL